MLAKFDLQAVLNGLQEIGDIKIVELMVPNIHPIFMLRISVEILPQSIRRIRISKNQIQEPHHSFSLSILRFFFVRRFVGIGHDAILNIKPKKYLQAPWNNLSLNDLLQPLLVHILINLPDMPYIHPMRMNDLGELYGIGKVWLLGLKILDDFLYPIIKFLVYLIFIDLIIPIPEENSLEFLPLH